MFGPNIDVYFKAPVFLHFEQDSYGGISIQQLTSYLSKRSHMHEMVSVGLFGNSASSGVGPCIYFVSAEVSEVLRVQIIDFRFTNIFRKKHCSFQLNSSNWNEMRTAKFQSPSRNM